MANRKSTPAPSSKPANNSEVKRAASVGDVKGKAKEVAEDVADDGSFQAGSPILFYVSLSLCFSSGVRYADWYFYRRKK